SVDAPDGLAHERTKGEWVAIRSDDDAREDLRQLPVGDVRLRVRWVSGTVVFGVVHDSNNGEPPIRIDKPELLADRRGVWPLATCRRLVHHDHGRGFRVVVLAQVPSREQWQAHGLEISGADRVELQSRSGSRLGFLLPGHRV